MVYASLLFALGGLMLGMRMSGLAGRIAAVAGGARHTIAVMRSRELHEEEKEAQVQRAALDLFGEFFVIAARSLAVFAAPAIFLLLCLSLGLFTVEEVEAAATNAYFIVASTLLMLAAWICFGRFSA